MIRASRTWLYGGEVTWETPMGVHAARVSDLRTIRRLDRDAPEMLLAPPRWSRQPSATTVALLSSWHGMGHRTHTLVLGGGNGASGFVQARARPGRESWDLVRMACLAEDAETWEDGCTELLNRVCAATAQRGALRTFARVPSESAGICLMTEHGFRPFASELPLHGTLRPLVETAPAPGPDVRPRLPRDAWDIFSLYCAVTPALVRHAEGRSLREWNTSDRVAARALARWQPVREVLVGEMGMLHAWLRWSSTHQAGQRQIEILTRPEAARRVPELLRYAAENLGLEIDRPTLCRVREYDGRVSATLEEAGFAAAGPETLLVRHTAARVTERQLLVAALRAQGLGIDISHYSRGAEPVHQRLASSREVANDYDGRYDRTRDHRRPVSACSLTAPHNR